MDYEKLIEQLKQKDGLWCSVPTGEKLVTDAADALTALLAENERLKNKLSELAHLPFDNPGVGERTRLMAENAQLRDELEQAKAEIIRLKHYEDKCHDCPIVCAKTEIIKAHEELETVQAELERVKNDAFDEAMRTCTLAADKVLLNIELEQVKRERDAAIRDIKCPLVCARCRRPCDGDETCIDNGYMYFEWVGVCEEN